jgi:hypothetical protein
MLRSDLEDYRYNSQVALGNLEAVYMDVLKTTGAMADSLQKITGIMSTLSLKSCRYHP